MARPDGPALLVVAAVIIAGCTAAEPLRQATVTPGDRVSPAPVPNATRTPGGDLAPGVTEAGIRWPYVLIRAHVRTLQGTSYTVSSRRTVDSTDADERRTTIMTGAFAINKSRYHQTFIERRGPNRTAIRSELYADGEQLFEAIGTGTDRRYYRPRSRLRTPPRSASFFGNPTQDDSIYIGIKAVETRLVSEATGREVRRFRFSGSRVRLPDLLSVGTTGTAVDRIEDTRLDVTVGRNGVVYEYRLRYTADLGNETLWVNHSITFSDVGATTVTAPEWYPLARQRLGEQGNATSL